MYCLLTIVTLHGVRKQYYKALESNLIFIWRSPVHGDKNMFMFCLWSLSLLQTIRASIFECRSNHCLKMWHFWLCNIFSLYVSVYNSTFYVLSFVWFHHISFEIKHPSCITLSSQMAWVVSLFIWITWLDKGTSYKCIFYHIEIYVWLACVNDPDIPLQQVNSTNDVINSSSWNY